MQIDDRMLGGKEATSLDARTVTSFDRQVAEARARHDAFADAFGWVPDPGLEGGLLLVSAMGVVYGAMRYRDFRRRSREEERYTGENFSLRELIAVPPKKGRAHRHNVAAPAVYVVSVEKPWEGFASGGSIWPTPGRRHDGSHCVLAAKTNHGKNDSYFDPMAAAIILRRPESAVIVDVKGDTLDLLLRRTGGRRFVYTCLPEHRFSSAINLIATPEMTGLTAAALYPTEHERQPFFNLSAAVLFYGAAEHLGFGASNIMEVRKLLFDRKKLKALARENEGINAVMEGEHKKSADEVVGAALLHLDNLKYPEVARMFGAPPGTSQPWFLEKETVWICFPEAATIGRLAGALVHNLRVRAKASRRGAYFLVDEAGSILSLQGLDECFQTGRGYRTHFMIVLQDLSQMIGKHGRHPVYSVLNNATLKIFGASDDPETREYFSSLSGTVQVRRRIYKDDGAPRTWRQFFGREGAPYSVREETRRGVMGEHVQEPPTGTWYEYSGDPRGISLSTSPPFSAWKDEVLPPLSQDVVILGVPARDPEGDGPGGDLPGGTGGPGVEEPRTCPGCGHEVANPEARFCEGCGARL